MNLVNAILGSVKWRTAVLVVGGLLVVTLVVVVTTIRLGDVAETVEGWSPAQQPTAAPAIPEHAEDHIDSPPATGTALQVVHAWITGDAAALDAVATPDLALQLAARPAPTGVREGAASVVTPGDTYQSVSVELVTGEGAAAGEVVVGLSWAPAGQDAWVATSVIAGA